MRNYLRALLIVLASSPAHAGDCSNATIWLSAFDKSGAIKADVRAEDLRIEIGGTSAQILSFSLDKQPRRILLMIDTSGSMAVSPGQSRLGIVLAAAGFAVDVLPPNSAASLLTFGENLVRESEGFETREVVGQRILELAKRTPKGHTALFDSLDQALATFHDPQFGDAIYLVTDGGDNQSKISLSKLREKLVARGVRVFVFLVQRPRYLSEEELQGVDLMEGLAKSTGGDFVPIPWNLGKTEREQLSGLAPLIVNQVEELYKVQLQVHEVAIKPTGVKVALADKNRRKDTREITYQRQLGPCLIAQ